MLPVRLAHQLILHEDVAGQLLIVLQNAKQGSLQVVILMGKFFNEYLYGFRSLPKQFLIDSS
jgi:hypothetical protein